MPFLPGQPMLVPHLAPWLTHRVTLESPSGPDWQTEATDVPAYVKDTLTPALDPRSGLLLQTQRSTLYVLHTVEIADNWRVTRADTGQRYLTGPPINNPEAPAVEVPLRAVH